MPLQLGLAVQMHHLYRSCFLIDSLSTMGFSSSYPEVQRFEVNAACSLAPDVLGSDMDILDTSRFVGTCWWISALHVRLLLKSWRMTLVFKTK